MSQILKDEISYYTGNDKVQFSIRIDLFQHACPPGAETQTASLGIPDNEPLEDAEKDMDEFTRNNINSWED